MNTNNKSEDSEFQEPEIEKIDVWEPIPTKTGDFDIQLPQNQITFHAIGAEHIEAWMAVNQELMRQEIARQLMKLYRISFFVGLVVFVLTGNIWLLTTFGLLAVLLRWIVGYYFRRPKK